ncbi:MAG: phosphatidylglycerol lysyltransferase domain-containing protein [Synergistaceae bacterium]|nr:phosphatidylglycerol lysyltransferase domain-containing protein [Synergistaceae bacterium]
METKTLYDRYAEPLPGALTSPLYFQSLYAWNFASVNRYEIFDGHLCIVAEDTMARETFALPPLGALDGESFANAVRAVFYEFERESVPFAFHEVPGFMLPHFSALDGYRINVSYERDWSDYVFRRNDFIEGLQKKSSREARRSFERRFRPDVREIASSDKDVVLAVTQKFFCEEKECQDCFCGCEFDVVSRMMEGWDELGMKGLILESGGEAIAFGTVCFQKDTVLFLSKKVRRRTRGLNEYLNAVLMDRFGCGYEYVNYSDDMGSDGLRAYKSRLGRYILTPRYVVKFLREA